MMEVFLKIVKSFFDWVLNTPLQHAIGFPQKHWKPLFTEYNILVYSFHISDDDDNAKTVGQEIIMYQTLKNLTMLSLTNMESWIVKKKI